MEWSSCSHPPRRKRPATVLVWPVLAAAFGLVVEAVVVEAVFVVVSAVAIAE